MQALLILLIESTQSEVSLNGDKGKYLKTVTISSSVDETGMSCHPDISKTPA